MERPKRQRRKPKAIEVTPSTRWSLKEKQMLLEAVKTHGKDQYDDLATCLPSKTASEVEWFLRGLSQRSKRLIPEVEASPNTPIELWLQMAEDLTAGEEEDLSASIAKALSIAGNLEPHVPRRTYRDPDYGAIYRYLAALLSGDDLPSLLDINAAVVLELLEETSDVLRNLDTTVQHRLMLHKHELLTKTAALHSSEDVFEATRRALENDIDCEKIEGKSTTEKDKQKRTTDQGAPRVQPASQSKSTMAARVGPPSGEQDVRTVTGDVPMLLVPAANGIMVPLPFPDLGKLPPSINPAQVIQLRFPPGITLAPGKYCFQPVFTSKADGRPAPPGGSVKNHPGPGLSAVGGNKQAVNNNVTQGQPDLCITATSGGKAVSGVHSLTSPGVIPGNQMGIASVKKKQSDQNVDIQKSSLNPNQALSDNSKTVTQTSTSIASIKNNQLDVPLQTRKEDSQSRTSLQTVTTCNQPGQLSHTTKIVVQSVPLSETGRRSSNQPEGTAQEVLDCVVKGAEKCGSKKRLKRSALYSLNPLCIPVKYLKPAPKSNPVK